MSGRRSRLSYTFEKPRLPLGGAGPAQDSLAVPSTSWRSDGFGQSEHDPRAGRGKKGSLYE